MSESTDGGARPDAAPALTENSDMSDEGQPDPQLLQRAVDDRAAHPWRYYRLDPDTMKRLLDEQAAQLAVAQAERDRLQQELTELRRARIGDAEIIGRWQCQAEKAEAELGRVAASARENAKRILDRDDQLAALAARVQALAQQWQQKAIGTPFAAEPHRKTFNECADELLAALAAAASAPSAQDDRAGRGGDDPPGAV